MSTGIVTLLLALHIGGMVSCLGTSLFTSLVMLPAVQGLEPSLRIQVMRRVVPRMGMAMALEAIVGGIGGIGLLYEFSGSLDSAVPQPTVLMAGAGLGALAFVLMAVHGIAMRRRARSATEADAPPPLAAKVLPLLGVLLLLAAFGAMVVGANLA